MTQSLLVITPVRNEAAHIEATVRAMQAQRRPPDAWLIVDDGSTDGTDEILRRLEPEVPFLEVLVTPAADGAAAIPDRLALAKESMAFNRGLKRAAAGDFTHIGKLDGDVELPAEWYEVLLQRFAEDPLLGVAGGTLAEPAPNGWRRLKIPEYHVHGAVKVYSADCFARIGGVRERLGWDTVDESYARMYGWRTRSFTDLVARHHRPWGSADGRLRGYARHGECAYILCYGLWWILLRSTKVARRSPYGVSGAAFVFGYLSAAVRRVDRVDDRRYRRFVRSELRRRLIQPSGRFTV